MFTLCSWQGILDTTICDKVCQWLAAGRWFPPDTPVSSTNKIDRLNIAEILLIVVLNTINQTILQCIKLYNVISQKPVYSMSYHGNQSISMSYHRNQSIPFHITETSLFHVISQKPVYSMSLFSFKFTSK